ncbi:hypothetical protein TNCV_2429791 [Trichonephila clavipes]|nr:hypothetical protein TNCV_2429791 [Trichonephila clavipes]
MSKSSVKKQCQKRILKKETLPLVITSLPERYREKLEKEFNETQENKVKCLQELKDVLRRKCEKEVNQVLEEADLDFNRCSVTTELTRIYTNKDNLSTARVELLLRVQFRGSGVKEGPPGLSCFQIIALLTIVRILLTV